MPRLPIRRDLFASRELPRRDADAIALPPIAASAISWPIN